MSSQPFPGPYFKRIGETTPRPLTDSGAGLGSRLGQVKWISTTRLGLAGLPISSGVFLGHRTASPIRVVYDGPPPPFVTEDAGLRSEVKRTRSRL